MKLFAGLDSTDYQDIMRALGFLCDTEGWRNLRIFEHEDGLIVQYTLGPTSQHFVTKMMSDDELRDLLREAYTRRQRPR